MRQRSDTWVRLAARGTARMESVAVIGGVEYAAISAPVINRGLLSADALSVGNCISSTLKFSVLTSDTIPKSASVIIKGRLVEGEIYSEWLEFGTFFIDRRTTNTGLVTLECYDAMLKANQQYVDESNPDDRIGWPKSMQACVNEVAYRLGVEIDPRTTIKTTDPYVVPYPTKYTMAQVLGYIGAAHGGNWVITPENKLRLVPLVSPPVETFNIVDYAYNRIYTDDGYKLVWKHTATDEVVEQRAGGGIINVPVVVGKITTGRSFTISRVTITRDSELGYTAGDSTGFELQINENPYACQAICDDLLSELAGIDYAPFSVTSAYYDPAAELGDWIIVGEQVRSVLYMETVTLGLSFRASASAPGKDELDSEYPHLTEIQKLKQEDERLQAYMDAAKDEISSKIEQTYTEIQLEVSGTYATKEAVSSGIQIVADAINQEVTRATAAEEQLSSKITTTAESIRSEVSKKVGEEEVNSLFEQNADAIRLKANAIAWESEYSSMSDDGRMEATSFTAREHIYVDGNDQSYFRIPFYIPERLISSALNLWMAPYQGYIEISSENGVMVESIYNPEGNEPLTSFTKLYDGIEVANDLGRKITVDEYGIDLISESNEFHVASGITGYYTLDTLSDDSSPLELSNEGDILANSLTVRGTKSRVAETADYSERLFYCYEMPSPIFGDIGEGVIAEDGCCYVHLDPVFLQAASTTQYHVFLQTYGEQRCEVRERNAAYFVVHGEPGAVFSWEVKAKQSGYEQLRLEKKIRQVELANNTEYAVDAANYIQHLKGGMLE